VFGLLALVGYPYLSEWLFAGDAQLAGFFLGTAIHDTAQVAGAGMVYLQQFGTDEALNTATVTKLIRNMFMLAVIPLVAYMHHRSQNTTTGGSSLRLSQAFPMFVLGFVAMTFLRTIGDAVASESSIISLEVWESVIAITGTAANWCLIIAMASVGLGTSFSRLKTLGFKPLVVGMVAATLLGVVSFSMIHVVSPLRAALIEMN
jgi:uncharacterized membrane protein YadS